jgi:uncharacterized protein (DUF2141 family)
MTVLYIIMTLFQGQGFRINVENIKTIKGNMLVAVYDLKGNRIDQAVVKVNDKTLSHVFKTPTQTEVIVKVFQDLNNNEKLDTYAIGLPKEPWGVSNNAPIRLGPPSDKDMTVNLKQTQTLNIRLR